MQNRRKFLTQTSFAVGAFTFLQPLKSFAKEKNASTKGRNLTILYTNGLSGQWTSADGSGMNGVKEAVAKIRREESNILLVDAGNVLAADSEKNIQHLHYYSALKQTGYDAITPGTTDLQHGVTYFAKLLERSRVHAIATNYTVEPTLEETVFSHKIMRKGGTKVGIIGIGNTGKISTASFAKLIDSINEKAEKLKQQNRCQLVVCLSHFSLRNEATMMDNLQLAQVSSAIDVVISANDEPFVYNTHVVKNKARQDVVVSHAGNKGSMLGRLDITFNEAGEKIAITTKQVFITADASCPIIAFKKHAARQLAV